MNQLDKSITLKYEAVDNLTYEDDGNYHIYLPTFYEFGSYSNDVVDFVFDTGAYITVVTRQDAALLGFLNKYTI